MKEFTKPYLANYGKAINLIQGECGYGSENYKLDKTGARKWSYKKPARHSNGTWVQIVCETFTLCRTKRPKDQC
ncbi:hypothetical protein [Clostridium botulinum]|uniref:hypothetical protein n=1 Tax=Clostridium botulinum TaxID=1491 RepID=UPI00035C1FD9|nr:hypothetical protein [Clostridium botulinum]MBN1037037.1 hypothetical protein [Clostridium botulinum]MBY6932195.1 hypothetical protein [Clostridium botulinum]NFG21644.1 hypothetical protein [Clostridium botulinum]NFG25262.1 hypothetical protein [Clostridium botulinum]NFO82290.1 hypothetical protein [Clostridium botulinum]